jgi:hypothetical protein
MSQGLPQPVSNRLPVAAGLDVFVVVAFVAIGRRNHDENPGIAGLVDTAAPFVLGLAIAWVIARAWREPWSWTTGLVVWVGTVAAGMLLRRFVFDDGTALSFVIVASVFLGTFLNGWRAVARALAGRRSPAPT